MFSMKDDVVDRLRELVDVLPVERGDVLRVQELDDLAREVVALVLELLDLCLAHLALRERAEARTSTWAPRPARLAGGGEQVVELRRPRDERQPHARGTVTEPAACGGVG